MFTQTVYQVQYPAGGINSTVTGYTPEQIKTELSGTYAELRNATPVVNVVNGVNVLTFTIPTGTKNAA
jgi:hypothetical protein